MTSVTVTPDPAVAGADDLTCDAVATDDDGDAILYTYEWSDSNGVQQTMTDVSDVSDVFLADGLEEDTWSCAVTPYDGTDYGSGMSGSVTVESGCSSLEFDGSSYVEVSDHSDLQTYSNGLTIEAWIYLTSYRPFQPIVHKHFGSSLGYYFALRDNGKLNYFTEGYSPGGVFTNEVVELERWTHIAVTLDGSNVHFWHNGTLVHTGTQPLPSPSNDALGIGGRANYSHFFDGSISTVSISDSVKYTTDFVPSTQVTITSNTIAFWEFSAGTGSTLYDQSGNGHDGTINGATWVNSCPEEDLDGDGVAAWEDCDDDDASLYDDCCYFGTCDWNTDLSSGIGIDWVDLSAGTSVDGSYSLSNDFSMMTTEVTQDMYETIIGSNPSHYVGSSQPVETLTWFEAAAFANALSILEGLPSCYDSSNSYLESGDYTGSSFYDCPGYRLPTEAEWQYSAQAGQSTTYAGGNTLDDVGWYNTNSSGAPQDVALKLANAWNIFDMSGNVNEWTHDRYGSFPNGSVDPIYSPNGSSDIAVRGGFWGANSSYHTSTYITAYAPSNLNNGHHGFRLVKTMPVDADGDGYASWEDCDDNDASVPSVNDADCDGVTTTDDCDDSDASISSCTVFSSGIEFTCLLDTNSEVQCWGRDEYGQGSPPSGQFRSLHNGFFHGCAIDATSQATCWGAGSGSSWPHYGQNNPPNVSFVEIAAGNNHSCGLDANSGIQCWGRNHNGQTSYPSGSYSKIDTFHSYNCAIDNTGSLTCWGSISFGSSPSGTFTDVAVGSEHACAIESTGGIVCWGSNYHGEGNPPMGSFEKISSGNHHSCAIDSTGQVQCWGENTYGQSNPTASTFDKISLGSWHSCGVTSLGTIECWGDDSYGQSTPPSNVIPLGY
jgi:hypothetical protein